MGVAVHSVGVRVCGCGHCGTNDGSDRGAVKLLLVP